MGNYPNENTTGGYPPPPQYGQYPPQQPSYPPAGYGPPSQPGFSQQPMPPGYPQMPPQQPVQPPKKKSKALWFILGIMGVVVLCSALANAGKSNPTTPEATTTNTTDIGNLATVAPQPSPTPTPIPKTWKTTHTYSGNGDKKTETFHVSDDWKIQWSCTPGSVSINYHVYINVYNSDGTMADWSGVSSECKTGNASGETQEHVKGDVYLDIGSIGDWAVTVQELK